MVHVGDTRLYQFYGNALLKISHDHSLIGYREEIGNLTEEEAMIHPDRNLINRLVGDAFHQVDDKNFIEAATFPLLPNSTLLLCSDGLCDMITSSEMSSVLKQRISLNDKAKELIRLANDKGGEDNITVVLIDYTGDESENSEPLSKPVKKTDSQIPTHADKKAGCFSHGILLMLLGLVICLFGGWFGGWFGHEKLSIPKEPLQDQIQNQSMDLGSSSSPSDLPIIDKETVTVVINDTITHDK